ncbi:hypothetical protein NDI56_06750 [Haloarcula sp. S1CR25-12]|uniref:DUF8135 domain-containing protein n=1 Tax=Haloarcula saliterrae TaxID=2950534 RepID=A0ABU2F9Y2_9EURY|nr:hypothetical protein [Haloarcula sp. S1CR25-12]MDS0259088.1 hypothetical protein [Haloarcula sp. S1CR25-12]
MSEDEADPFEAFDDEDREGDPFERLDDAGPEDVADDAPAARDDGPSTPDGAEPATSDNEPEFEEAFIDEDDPFATDEGPATEGASTAGDDDPFAGMDAREGDPFATDESVFEAVDIDRVDPDEVWASLDSDEDGGTFEGSRYVEVSKHRFCEQCEHFSSPPAARCTNEDAEIIEFLDMETVRLLNCPVVAEQRELESEG